MADILFASNIFEVNFSCSLDKLQAIRTSTVFLFTAVGRCAYRNFQRDRQMVYNDKSLSAFSDASCQHACDVEREFVCRSYTFLSTVSNHALVCYWGRNNEVITYEQGPTDVCSVYYPYKKSWSLHFFTVETLPTHTIVMRSSHMNEDEQMFAQFTTHTKSPYCYIYSQ